MTFSEWKKKKKAEEKAKETSGAVTSFEDWKKKKNSNELSNSKQSASVPEENTNTWFKDVKFEGEYDDNIKRALAVGGTTADIILNAGKGVGRMVEGLVDLGTYGVAGVADWLGNEKFADKARKVAQYSATDEWTKGATEFVDKYSYIGDKGDAIAEGLGQVGAILLTGGLAGAGAAAAGASSAGVFAASTAATTAVTGLSSMGSGMNEAYKMGASDGEAVAFGATVGTIDAVSELVFAGLGKGVKALGVSKGLTSIDDVLAKKLSKTAAKFITSEAGQKIVGNTIEYAVKSGAEGVEELMSGFGSAMAKDFILLNGEDEEKFSKIIEDENLLEQFVVGSIVSAIAQGGDYVDSISNKADFVSGHTASEEKVINKVAEKEIAEREADGKKLSAKEKNGIYEDVVKSISKGTISVDTIEEALGGESYDAYKKAVETKKEFNELNSMKSGDLTGIQSDRLKELKAMGDEKYFDDEIAKHKTNLSDSVLNLIKSDRGGKGSLLIESYNERAREYEGFKADYTKYEGTKHENAARQTIDNAIKAGANNKNTTHDIVDMAAKLSSDTGIVYKFGDNETIKQDFIKLQSEKIASLEAVENPTEAQIKELAEMKTTLQKVQDGKITVNGNLTSDGVMLNLDSSNPLNRIVGHEITHTLENTEHYEKLQKALFDYAKTKGIDIDAKIKELSELYKGVEGANPKGELTSDLVGAYLFNDYEFVQKLSADKNMFQKVWDEIKYLCKIATTGSKEAKQLAKVERMFAKAYSEIKTEESPTTIKGIDGEDISPERISKNEADNQYSLTFAPEIAQGQSAHNDTLIKSGKSFITNEELKSAQEVTRAMVDVMMKYSNILPEDKIGKVLTKNGSYDVSVENTTICVRTLAYNEFVDKVQEEIGRPLSQMESFLVSQKLYDIATEPQCLYCYVSLDRKAYNDMLLRYMSERDTVIDKYKASDKSAEVVGQLYQEFLNGRKDTKNMKARFNAWINAYDNGTQMLSLADIATDKRMADIMAKGGELANQLKDARTYAQNASWAKIQKDYVAYKDEILKLSDNVIKNLNEHYGMRWYSFSDYSPAFIVENMQQITDASIRGLKGLSYTKDTDFAEIFAPSGMNINISVFVNTDKDGNFYIDERQSAKLEEAIDLRKRYPNVGIVATVTDDAALEWAGKQEWTDVIIPFHIVRTGTDIAEFYKWLNYTSESADSIKDKDMWEAYVDSLGKKTESARKKVSKNIYPKEHHNDKATYLELCENRGLTPRFARFAGEDWYMKLVNETRLSADESKALKPIFNQDAAETSFDKFIKKGGYEGGWYNDKVNVDTEVKAVASDVLAGKKANEVDYGRQDLAPESLLSSRKANRKHGKNSLSTDTTEDIAPIGRNEALGENFKVKQANELPGATTNINVENVDNSVDTAPLPKNSITDDEDIIKTIKDRLNAKLTNSTEELEKINTLRAWTEAQYEHKIEELQKKLDSKKDKNTKVAIHLQKRISNLRRMASDIDADLQKRIADIEARIGKTTEKLNQKPTKKDALEIAYERIDNKLEADKMALTEEYAKKKADAEAILADKDGFISNKAKELYDEIRNLKKGVRASAELGYLLDYGYPWKVIKTALLNAKNSPSMMVNNNVENENYTMESITREMLDEMYEDASSGTALDTEYNQKIAELEAVAKLEKEATKKENERIRRKDLHSKIIGKIKAKFAELGFDFDEVIDKGKRLSTFSTVDNTPQRVNDKTFGYEEGEILNDLTFNQVALNESEGIKWLNDRVQSIRKLSEKYNIKPKSKESKAAQIYAEGFYADDRGNLIKYGDEELAKDFPNAKTQANIRGLANDAEIRRIYDETLDQINESRVRNGYDAIPKRENYFLHFRAMEDIFSKLGIPFNPEVIKAKDLPTDINGRTADLKPGQPYFASANRRMGVRTSYDLLGGMERYMNSAKNQIYHIDDIQTIRAIANHIADTYGQANGLSNLEELTPEEQDERIRRVYDKHLSTYAKFLNEYANHLAGKTTLIDRGVEGIFGRQAIQALKTFNSQVGRNMVGWNVSSAGTNFLSLSQAAAKLPKSDMIKAFAQTISNKFRKDGFVENNAALIRRKGADKFSKTMWEKATDAGYFLMSAVDDLSSEVIVRAKYNELVRKGMDSEKAHIRAGEWAMRLLGDRSLGQMPIQYNSAFMGIFNKFQLEARNQLDSMVYDTINEHKASDGNNAEKAFKIAKTMTELAIFQHIFGMAYEKIAGYNPAFDIVSTIATMFGWDDDEDDEDTFIDNLGQASKEFVDDLPYANLITGGGRIPVSSALPIKQIFSGKDNYGNDVPFLETLGQAAGYALLPGGYGQFKKTYQSLKMFDDDLAPTGSYTKKGNLRFPVEDTPLNRIQAALFGQYASKNAREYFDEEYAPLKPNQIAEFNSVGMSFTDYHKYRDGLNKLSKVDEKFDYINSLDLSTEQKNILINNVVDRKVPVDMTHYGDYESYEEFDFATKYPEKHLIAEFIGGYDTYDKYTSAINKIESEKDKNGKAINGSRKNKVIKYIDSLDLEYGEKLVLFRGEYPSDDTYNVAIVEYLQDRDDIPYEERLDILASLGMIVDKKGNVRW